MTATPGSDLAGRLQQELERERQERFRELGDEPLAWLAIAPLWNDRVARLCGFPERPLTLPDFLAHAEAAGWCVRREAEAGSRTPWLRLEVAVDLFPYLSAEWREPLTAAVHRVPDEGVRSLLLDRIGGGRPERQASPPEVDPETVRRLVADGDPVVAARLLRDLATRWLPREELRTLTVVLADRLGSAPPTLRALALADVVAAQAQVGLVEQGLEVARRIEDARARVNALGELVAPLARATGLPSLGALVEECMGLARAADGSLDPTVVAKLASQLAEVGALDHLRRLAEQALAAARRAVPTPALVGAMQRIAAALDDAALTPPFVQVTVELASRIGDPVARAAALASTAALLRRQDPASAERYPAISDAALLGAALAIEHGEDRVRALARLVPLVAEDLRQGVTSAALAHAAQVEETAGEVTFWMPDSARVAVIEELRRRRDFRWLQGVAVRLGRNVREQRGSVAVPPPLARWAELASAADAPDDASTALDVFPQRAAERLDRRIAELLAVGDTGQALTWLDTARSLGPLLLGQFEVSVLANTRRVELVHRRWLDRRRLERFLPRAEQLRAFEDLLDQPDVGGAWALHYLGVGGVGKTMLIRHLTGELAPAHGALTSRIDFDHLNPDFPRRRPAQLLVELATELETQAQDTRLIGLFRSAYEALREVNARAEPATIDDERFAKALRTFAGFLRALDRRVVLILDTCEELEKFRPAGGRLEQLEATFEVLEELHRQVPALRVVLAGRRPLARSGHGWRLADLAGRRHALLPAEKPDLLLHEVRGFDQDEAEEFLTRRAGLRRDQELLAEILERSPNPGTAADIEWDDGREPVEIPRYNPFDLDLIAGWVRADPDLTAAELRTSQSDLYVETRIVGRLKDPDVERLLPAVVALGRFDRDMLRLAFDGDEQALTDAERTLASAEWIDVQRDEALDTSFLEVDRNLRPRLEAQYRRQHPGLLREAARRLAPGLARMVGDPERQRPFGRLGFEHVDAALRLLPPADAARLVDRLAMRVIEEAAAAEPAWGWAETVTERLLAPGSPLAEPDHPAGAGLRAMLASALRHLDPQRGLSELWAAVEQSAHNHPDPEIAEWLAQRAYLQLLDASSGDKELQRLLASLGSQVEARRQVLVGGLLSALQGLLDLAEASSLPAALPGAGVAHHAVHLAVSDPAAETGNPAADAFRHMLLGRTALLQGRFDDARVAFGDAVTRLADDVALTPWLRADWEPPEDLPARVLLEVTRVPLVVVDAATEEFPPAGATLQLVGERLGGLDAERFASAFLDRRLLAHEVVPAEVVARYERLPDLYDERRPACEAHRAVPPFFITLARAWAALGRAQRALAVLQRGHTAAVEQRDAATVAMVASARLEVVRRFRLATEERRLREQMLHSKALADRQRAWPVVALVDPPEPTEPPLADAPPADWHAWWRVQSAAIGLDQAINRMTRRQSGGEPEPRSFAGLSLQLDFVELRELRLLPSPAFTLRTVSWAAEHPLEAEHAVRLELRRLALFDAAPDLDQWVALLGRRRVAELALDEGELLALRLPDQAQRLLSRAARLFSEAADPVGAFIARVLVALTFEDVEDADPVAVVVGWRVAYQALPQDPDGQPLPQWSDVLALGRTRGRFDHPDWGGWLPRLLVAYARLNGATQSEALSLARDHGLRSAELRDAGRGDKAPAAKANAPASASPEPVPRTAAVTQLGAPKGDTRPPPQVQQARQARISDQAGPPPAARAAAPGLSRLVLVVVLVLLAVVGAVLSSTFLLGSGAPTVTGPTTVTRPAVTGPTVTRPDVTPPTRTGGTSATGTTPRTTGSLGREPGGGLPWGLVLGLVAAVGAVGAAALLFRDRFAGVPRLRIRPEVGILAIRPAGVGGVGFDLLGGMTWSGKPPSFEPYSRQRRVADEPLPAQVALRVAPELANLPWEAVVLPATRPPRWTEGRACWRELRPLPTPPRRLEAERPPWWRRAHGTCAVLAPTSWLPLLAESLDQVEIVDWGLVDWLKGRPEILVLLGTPVETSAGTRLEVQDEGTEQRLVEPDDSRWHDHQLVVVMGLPGGSLARVNAEREITADLRQCAADLAAAGAGSVLCLPSMPRELARWTLEELDRQLWRVERRGWRALVSATEALRELIEARAPNDDVLREAAEELALEVTVFVRPDRAT